MPAFTFTRLRENEGPFTTKVLVASGDSLTAGI